MSSFKGKTHTQKLQLLIDQGYQHLKYKRWRNYPAPIPAGYTFKKEPLKRTYPKFTEREPIKPLTTEQLKELGITPNN